jgi:MFS family permease
MDSSSTLPRNRRMALVAVIGAATIVTLCSGLAWPLLSLRLAAMGHSGSEIGFSTAAQSLAMVAVAPFVARWAARVGAIRLMLAAVVGAVAMLVAMAAWETYAAWFVLRFLLGVCMEILYILSDAWVIQLAPPAIRGRILGIYTSVSLVGFACGPLVIDVVGVAGWTPFLVGAVCVGLAAIPLWASRRIGPAAEGRTSRTFFSFFLAAPVIMLAGAMFGFVDVMALALLPVYALRSGFDESGIARLVTYAVVGSILWQIPLGWLCDRVERRLILAGCTLTACLCGIALPFAIHTLPAAVAVLVMWGGAMGGFFTVGMVMLGERYQGPDLLAANAFFVLMFGFGSMVGPTIGGIAMDLWDPHGMPAVMALISAIFLPFALRGDRPAR